MYSLSLNKSPTGAHSRDKQVFIPMVGIPLYCFHFIFTGTAKFSVSFHLSCFLQINHCQPLLPEVRRHV